MSELFLFIEVNSGPCILDNLKLLSSLLVMAIHRLACHSCNTSVRSIDFLLKSRLSNTIFGIQVLGSFIMVATNIDSLGAQDSSARI
jgi:hypothetical protein